jgi:hypothetical protein
VAPTFRLLDEISAVRTVVKRYGRDLADACLVRMSEIHSDCVVLTIDSEFRDVIDGMVASPSRRVCRRKSGPGVRSALDDGLSPSDIHEIEAMARRRTFGAGHAGYSLRSCGTSRISLTGRHAMALR